MNERIREIEESWSTVEPQKRSDLWDAVQDIRVLVAEIKRRDRAIAVIGEMVKDDDWDGDCPPSPNKCKYHVTCAQCWINFAMEENE